MYTRPPKQGGLSEEQFEQIVRILRQMNRALEQIAENTKPKKPWWKPWS